MLYTDVFEGGLDIKRLATAVVVLVVLTLAMGSAAAASGTWDSFDRVDGPMGLTATGLPWSAVNSTWGVRAQQASLLTTRYADTLAYAVVNGGVSSAFTVSADVRLSPTFQRANGGLTVLFASGNNNIFCKTEVTHANPSGLMSIGRRLSGRTTSLLASIRNTGFVNGGLYHVTCGRTGDVITMTVTGGGVGPLSVSYTLTSADRSAFGSATLVGLRSHVFTDEDDRLTSYDNFAVTIG